MVWRGVTAWTDGTQQVSSWRALHHPEVHTAFQLSVLPFPVWQLTVPCVNNMNLPHGQVADEK